MVYNLKGKMNCFPQGRGVEPLAVNSDNISFQCLFVQIGSYTQTENWHEHSALKVFLGAKAPRSRLIHVKYNYTPILDTRYIQGCKSGIYFRYLVSIDVKC